MTRSHVLVLRPGALGDTIVTADALAAIHAQSPAATVELVGNAPAGALLKSSGLVDTVTSFESPEVSALFGREPRVVERWRDVELVVLWLANPERIAAAFERAGASAVIAATPPAPHQASESKASDSRSHISDFLVANLCEVGIERAASAPTLLGRSDSAAPISEKTAIVHPGSGSPAKNWPAPHFAAIGRRLTARGWNVRLLRGPADRDAVSAVMRTAGNPGWALEEPTDPTALSSLLARAALYIGNDSGVAHLSARLGRPTVALFGPTDPAIWAPRGPCVAVLGGVGRWPSEEQACGAIQRFIEL